MPRLLLLLLLLTLSCRGAALIGADARPRGCWTWRTAFVEDFEQHDLGLLGAPVWQPDDYPDDGPYAERGAYFTRLGISAPRGFRAAFSFGRKGWLTAASYALTGLDAWAERLAVVPDPAGGSGRVLRLRSPAHTDATIVQGSTVLPRRYRLSLRVGYADFGDGRPGGRNGYDSGTERAEPWKPRSAVDHNGFYWLAILDHPPRPHNNIWIHHHRKVVIDSCNHFPPWMEIYDGHGFVPSGAQPVMMFVLDGRHPEREQSGPLFHSYSAGRWQPLGAIRAVDAYRPQTWYSVAIARDGDRFEVQVAGNFRHGGQRRYQARIDAAQVGVFHHEGPDFFMFGDPHINYYEGQVHYDDIRLEFPGACAEP